MAVLSAIIPKTGDVMATKRVENPIAKLHIELAVKLNDHIEVLFPSEFWNKTTKYTGSIATDMLVAKPEFAQSYIYQPSNDFLFWGVKSDIFISTPKLNMRQLSSYVDKFTRHDISECYKINIELIRVLFVFT